MSRILPLPPDAISKIHSSKNITTLQGVVFALLQNSLDAAASKIEITVDFQRGGCTVEDNGSGIAPGEFLENGGLGRMYHTSKQVASSKDELHGTTGTYLASLSALSLLRISSHHVNHDQQATLTIHQGKVIAREVQAPPAKEISPSVGHGTCVTIRDLFGNMPVRVKQRALAANGTNDNEWFELKHGIVALLLSWPKPCAVNLRNVEAESEVVHLSGVHPTINPALTKGNLDQLSGKSPKFTLKDVLPVLTQAGFSPIESRMQWIPVSTSTPRFSVKGTICLNPAPTKRCQFISVGIHPCSISSGSDTIYDSVNKVFSNSSFGVVDDVSDLDEMEKDRRKRDRRFKSAGFTQKQLRGRKGVDRWPMFVLQVRFVDQDRRTFEPERMSESNLKAIVDILEATSRQWLAANHFRPRKVRQRNREKLRSPLKSSSQTEWEAREVQTPIQRAGGTLQSATTSKKRKYFDIAGNTHGLERRRQVDGNTPSDYFSSWSRIKSGKNNFYDQVWQAQKPATAPADQRGTRTLPTETKIRSVFDLPILEAAALNSEKVALHKNTVDEPATELVSVGHACPQQDEQYSSEEYGSFDDLDVLAAVGTVGQPSNDEALYDTGSRLDIDALAQENNDFNDTVIDWTNPVTKQTFRVNARTGVVLPSRPKSAVSLPEGEQSMGRHGAGTNTSLSSTGHALSLARRPASSKRNGDRWLPGFLKDWNNPVFVQQEEERIPTASPGLLDAHANCAAQRQDTHNPHMVSFQEIGTTVTRNVSKTALKKAKVVKQVDQKYILCVTRMGGRNDHGDALILIDQHAASERVILEDLLADLCSQETSPPGPSRSKIKTSFLEKPVRFQISEVEYRRFYDHMQHFANWGILYELTESDEVLSGSHVRAPQREFTIIVQYLPPGIAERCLLVPKVLIELLRSEIWSIAESAKKLKNSFDSNSTDDLLNGEHLWLKQLATCPKDILDMLNSRACRSAIMFNDELSHAQCQQLLSDLSKCAFPFMCAHGRVSMVPLIETGTALGPDGGGIFSMKEERCEESFTKAFRNWIGRDSPSSSVQIRNSR